MSTKHRPLRAFHRSCCALLLGALAVASAAQGTITIPLGLANTEGNSSNAFPWGRGGSGLRICQIYDSVNFTAQGVNHPIVITRLRWRPTQNWASVASIYPLGATVQLSTCPVDYSAVQSGLPFSYYEGQDLTTVYQGPVSWPAAAAMPGPCPWSIDLPLQTPFVYDPQAGDLDIETDLPVQQFAGTNGLQLDAQTTAGTPASRAYLSVGYPYGSPSVTQSHGMAVEVSFVPANGNLVTVNGEYVRIGMGCGNQALPEPQLVALNTPQVGAPFQLELQNVAPNSLGAFLFGLSDRAFSAGWLPYELTLFGAPDCWIGNSMDAVAMSIAQANGTAPYVMSLPGDPMLFGATLYAQGATFANNLFATSAWGSCWIGGSFVSSYYGCQCTDLTVKEVNKPTITVASITQQPGPNLSQVTFQLNMVVSLNCGPRAGGNCTATITPTVSASWQTAAGAPVTPVTETLPGAVTVSAECTNTPQPRVVTWTYVATFVAGTLPNSAVLNIGVGTPCPGGGPPNAMKFLLRNNGGVIGANLDGDGDADGDGKLDRNENNGGGGTHKLKWDTNGDGTPDQ